MKHNWQIVQPAKLYTGFTKALFTYRVKYGFINAYKHYV